MQTALGASAEATTNLRSIGGQFTADQASAMGFNANANAINISNDKGAGVTTLKGAMAVMKIADAAIKRLDQVRSDLGSVQNTLVSTVNNISVTQVNVKAAESNIRDVDFASESANFSKFNILAQSGSYAMSQANAVQQNVLRLLQ
jgi:flagellin